jgi:type IV pilus assembly protein PilM
MAIFSFGGKSLLGIDIGASAIKVIKGQVSRGKFQVQELSSTPLPFGAITERGVEDRNLVQAAIKNAISSFGNSLEHVATSVKGAGVLTKRVVMPKVPQKEIAQQVKWEAEQVFPTDISNILVSYLLLGEGTDVPMAPPGTKGWDVLLVGVQKDSAHTYKSLVDDSGARTEVLDVDAFASTDLLAELLNFSKREAVALVDVGATGTRVTVRRNGNVVFLREFGIGGMAFTESISQTLGLTVQDAEALKLNDGSPLPQEAHDALAGVFQSWKSELQQCEDVFVSQSSNELIKKWYFYGGASQTQGLATFLNDERFQGKIVFLRGSDYFVSKNKAISDDIISVWGLRLFTAAGLTLRGNKK